MHTPLRRPIIIDKIINMEGLIATNNNTIMIRHIDTAKNDTIRIRVLFFMIHNLEN